MGAGWGFEPQTTDYETVKLPLLYPAINPAYKMPDYFMRSVLL